MKKRAFAKAVLWLTMTMGALPLIATVEYETITASDFEEITDGQGLLPLLPPGYKEPVFSGLMEQSDAEHMEVTWGDAPAFVDIEYIASYTDTLPTTAKVPTVVYDTTPLRGVFEDLAQQMQISFITPRDLEREDAITARFYNLSPTDIFRALVDAHKLELREKFGAYTLVEQRPPQPIFRKYQLDFNFLDEGETAAGGTALGSSTRGTGTGTGTTGFGSTGGGRSLGSSLGGTVEADYSTFLENIEQMASIRFETGDDVVEGEAPVVVYDEDNRTLFVQATEAGHEAVLTYLTTINKPQENIAIEIFVAETTLRPTEDLGIAWNFDSESSFNDAASFSFGHEIEESTTNDTENNPTGWSPMNNLLRPGAALPGNPLSFGTISMNRISAAIRMLQQNRTAQSYVHPRVLTTNNQPVTLESYVEIPFQSSTTATSSTFDSVSSNTSFKEAGISINILPILQGEDILRMKVAVTNTSIVEENADDRGTPSTAVRSYAGTFTMSSGEYIVIAGIGESLMTHNKSGVPYLQSLPVFGRFFQNTQKSKNTSHLLVFIRPVVKKQYRKGLDVDVMGKSALFTEFEEGKLNFTTEGLYSRLKNVPDPFMRSDLNHSIIRLQEDLEQKKAALQILEDYHTEKQEEISVETEKKQEKLEELDSAMESSEGRELQTVVEEKQQIQQDMEDLKERAQEVERTYEAARDPLLDDLERLNRQLEQESSELDRMIEAEQSRLPDILQDAPLRMESVVRDNKEIRVGAQVLSVPDDTPITVSAEENKQAVVRERVQTRSEEAATGDTSMEQNTAVENGEVPVVQVEQVKVPEMTPTEVPLADPRVIEITPIEDETPSGENEPMEEEELLDELLNDI